MVSYELCLYKISSSSFGIKVDITQEIGLHKFENGHNLSNQHGPWNKNPNEPKGKQVFIQLGTQSSEATENSVI